MIKYSLGLWLFILVAGISAFAKFAYTPGETAHAPKLWPALTRLKAPNQLPKLLVFVHPKCGCSEATLRNLEKILPDLVNKVQIKIVMNDLGDPAMLQGSKAFAQASAFKNVDIVVDHGGYETAAFGVKTSGQAMLYDETGHLVFQGGLTPFRGHEGVSEGEISVVKWIQTREMVWKDTSVFGCAMKEKI